MSEEKVKTEEEVKKYQDFYQKLRIKIKKWADQGKLVPSDKGWSGKLAGYLMVLPDLAHLTIKLLLDKEIPKRTKFYIGGALGYLILPIDFLPDFIPVLGFTDDLVVIVIVLNRVINDHDPVVTEKVKEYWAGDGDVLEQIKHLTTVVNDLLAQLPEGLAKFLRKKK
jgi:uncharacterized membrane protein YkvA (DUF1232 family)